MQAPAMPVLLRSVKSSGFLLKARENHVKVFKKSFVFVFAF